MNNFREIFDRLKQYYQVNKDKEVAEKLGVNYNTVKTWSTRGKIPLDSLVDRLQNETIDLNWLLTGKGSMFGESAVAQTKDIIQIPYYPDIYAAAGAGGETYAAAPRYLPFSKSALQELLGTPIAQNLHIINAVGDSMEPTIQSGDKLFVLPFADENHQIKEGAIYIIATPQGTLVKRLYPNPFAHTITLRSDNPAIADITIQGDELDATHIVGRVLGILRQT